MGDDMLTQCSERWPGLQWRYESEFGRAVGEFDGERLASVTVDRMPESDEFAYEACVFGPPRLVRWHGKTPGAALSGAMAEALTRAIRFAPPKVDASDAAEAVRLVAEYQALAKAASRPNGRMVPCDDPRLHDGTPAPYDGGVCGYEQSRTTCYERARDSLREFQLGVLDVVGTPEWVELMGEDEWCAGCRENEQIWHEHRDAVRERAAVKRSMCALARAMKRPEGGHHD